MSEQQNQEVNLAQELDKDQEFNSPENSNSSAESNHQKNQDESISNYPELANLIELIDPEAPTQIELETEHSPSKTIDLPSFPPLPKPAELIEAELNTLPQIDVKIPEDAPMIKEETEAEISPSPPKQNLVLDGLFGFLRSGILLPFFVIGMGIIVAFFALNTLKSSEQSGSLRPTEITNPNSQNNPVPTDLQVQVYWLQNDSDGFNLAPQSITIDKSDTPQNILTNAFKRLLAGSNNPEQTSSIPEGTKLLNLRVVGQNIYIDLSQEFTTGGGTASMTGRLAQVLYTATSLDLNAQVYLNVEGEPLEVLGGEGLMVDQPLTRGIFETNFPL